MMRRVTVSLLAVCLTVVFTGAQESVDVGTIARFKEEGLKRSRARELFLTLTDSATARKYSSATPQEGTVATSRSSRTLDAAYNVRTPCATIR